MAESRMYPVMERFPTLQGEGFWTGHAAWFMRLGGCDVGCTWCDVKESWPVEVHPRVALDTLVEEAVASQIVVGLVMVETTVALVVEEECQLLTVLSLQEAELLVKEMLVILDTDHMNRVSVV